MHQANRFFARLPQAVVTAPTPHDANGKLDQLLREFQEQKEALSYSSGQRQVDNNSRALCEFN